MQRGTLSGILCLNAHPLRLGEVDKGWGSVTLSCHMDHVLLNVSLSIHICTYLIDKILDHLHVSVVRCKVNGRVAPICLHVGPIPVRSRILPHTFSFLMVPCMLVNNLQGQEIVLQGAESQQCVLANVAHFHDGALVFLTLKYIHQIYELVLAYQPVQSRRHRVLKGWHYLAWFSTRVYGGQAIVLSDVAGTPIISRSIRLLLTQRVLDLILDTVQLVLNLVIIQRHYLLLVQHLVQIAAPQSQSLGVEYAGQSRLAFFQDRLTRHSFQKRVETLVTHIKLRPRGFIASAHRA